MKKVILAIFSLSSTIWLKHPWWDSDTNLIEIWYQKLESLLKLPNFKSVIILAPYNCPGPSDRLGASAVTIVERGFYNSASASAVDTKHYICTVCPSELSCQN